jgi:hypothetical protein
MGREIADANLNSSRATGVVSKRPAAADEELRGTSAAGRLAVLVLGDTAWALYTDKAEEKHDRLRPCNVVPAHQRHQRVALMLLGEAGWGNRAANPGTICRPANQSGYWWKSIAAGAANSQDRSGGWPGAISG